MLELRNIRKDYAGMSELSYSFDNGTVYSLIGPNGAGKTTLCNIMTGMLSPDEGEVYLNNVDTRNRRAKKDIGYALDDDSCYPNMKLYDLFRFLLTEKYGEIDNDKLEELLVGYELIDKTEKKYRECSLGMKKKVRLILSIYNDPLLVVLDEPTNSIDTSAIIRLKDDVRRLEASGSTVIIASHSLDFVEKIAKEHLFLKKGILKASAKGDCDLEECYKAYVINN